MSWGISISADGSTWQDFFTLEKRNVSGSPCTVATRITSPITAVHPGVLRFTVKPGTLVAQTSCTLLTDVVRTDDLRHPLIDLTGKVVSLAPGNSNANLIPGCLISLNPTMGESDIFEVGPGCTWNATTGEWESIAVLGMAYPGYPGTSMYIRVTNNYSHDMVSSVLQFELIGDSVQLPMIQARVVSDGTWYTPDYDNFFVYADDCVPGHIPAGDHCDIEVRPYPDDNATADDNPVAIDFSIQGLEV